MQQLICDIELTNNVLLRQHVPTAESQHTLGLYSFIVKHGM